MRDLPAERVIVAARALLRGADREAPCASR
jgi:hypothetical protein